MTLRIVVPARLASSRLPGKMLAHIGDKVLVQHSVSRIIEAADGQEVFLATDDYEIGQYAGHATVVMVKGDIRSGTDRCARVATLMGWPDEDVVVNIQADMPFIQPEHLRKFFASAARGGRWDMLTAECDNRFVEATVGGFQRIMIPTHVGFYAYKLPKLLEFAALETGDRENLERLEQLRAVAAGMKIDFHAVPNMPFEINTKEDLELARHIARCLQ